MVKKFDWYPADDEKVHHVHKKPKQAKDKGLKPGQVLILLAGRFRGSRVVFLKQLPSGLLLVTGPYKINGVPVKRAHYKYVIPTTTFVDVKGVDVSKVDDKLFAREKKAKKSQEEKFFAADKVQVRIHPT